jgi:hypothetical protein
MNRCNECAIETLRYLDDTLEAWELLDFLAHLQICASCRAHLEAERELSVTLHRSRPLYSARVTVRDRVAASVMSNGRQPFNVQE